MTARRSIRSIMNRQRKRETDTPIVPAAIQTGNRYAGESGPKKISSGAKVRPITTNKIGKRSAMATYHLMRGSPFINSMSFISFMLFAFVTPEASDAERKSSVTGRG